MGHQRSRNCNASFTQVNYLEPCSEDLFPSPSPVSNFKLFAIHRCKMRHRDPRLFFLSMEVRIRRADARTMLVLDDSARPALLQACHPSGESKFHLQMKTGGLIRVHTTALQQASQYKSLLISEQTTSDELLALLLSCYNLSEPVEEFSLYEVCPDQEYQRKLHPDDLPLRAQAQRNQKGENCHFLVRRIRNLSRRVLKLDESEASHSTTISSPTEALITDMKPLGSPSFTTKGSTKTSTSPSSISFFKTKFTKPKSCSCKAISHDTVDVNGNVVLPQKSQRNLSQKIQHCVHCNQRSSNLLKGFQDTLKLTKPSTSIIADKPLSSSTYNPVYNIREIRTVGNSFSSLGNDKKLMDIDGIVANSAISRRHSVAVDELVNTHPPKGIGNYVYI